MLQGDGAFFVYVLCVGHPWFLKWQAIAARASTYVLTVAPSQWAMNVFHLSPMAVASANGFFYYLCPLILFATACALVQNKYSQFIVFPVAQYALSSSMGYGFPSEIALSPGFLWICLFLILRK